MIPMFNHDLDVVSEYGSWLRNVNWDLFGTLTFDPKKSLHSTASRHKMLVHYLSSLERYYRRKIRCFWAEEKRWSGCGLPAIAPHFHLLLACDRRPLDPDYPRQLWENLAGKAEMRVYDFSLDGAIYCAKLIASPDASYDLVNFSSPATCNQVLIRSPIPEPEHAQFFNTTKQPVENMGSTPEQESVRWTHLVDGPCHKVGDPAADRRLCLVPTSDQSA